MSGFELLGERTFTIADQREFARMSGDHNPMHLDPLAARRMQAGVPVVHGVNAMLWALDRLYEAAPDKVITGLEARFEKFVPIDQPVSLWLQHDDRSARLEIRSDDSRLMSIRLAPQRGSTPLAPPPGGIGSSPDVPAEPAFADAATAAGAFALRPISGSYRYAVAQLGQDRVAAVVALSTLVGMIVPGLNSIFSSLELRIDEDPCSPGALAYRVEEAHDLFRLLGIAFSAPGVSGKVKAFMRPPAVSQPTTAELAGRIARDACAGVAALVVGGSRGLGEATAKLLAAGGARVAITYATGADDAAAVAADIRGFGAECAVLQLDMRADVAEQLRALPFAVDQIYYFATSKIFHQDKALLAAARFDAFERIYVHGLHDLAQFFSARGRDVLIFNPSSVAVAERPRGMTEYSMAKAASEILCEDIDRFMPHVKALVRRLPRLLTDQTSTVTPEESQTAADAMMAIVEAMMAASGRRDRPSLDAVPSPVVANFSHVAKNR